MKEDRDLNKLLFCDNLLPWVKCQTFGDQTRKQVWVHLKTGYQGGKGHSICKEITRSCKNSILLTPVSKCN